MAVYRVNSKLLSGIELVRPIKLIRLYVAGSMISVTPKKDYLAFMTDYRIIKENKKTGIQTEIESVTIIYEGYRYFHIPLVDFEEKWELSPNETTVKNDSDWFDSFNRDNKHIRNMNESFVLQF